MRRSTWDRQGSSAHRGWDRPDPRMKIHQRNSFRTGYKFSTIQSIKFAGRKISHSHATRPASRERWLSVSSLRTWYYLWAGKPSGWPGMWRLHCYLGRTASRPDERSTHGASHSCQAPSGRQQVLGRQHEGPLQTVHYASSRTCEIVPSRPLWSGVVQRRKPRERPESITKGVRPEEDT